MIAKSLSLLACLFTAFALTRPLLAEETKKENDAVPATPLAFTMKDIDGKEKNLADYRGKVVLMVNVASKCGNTPQYAGLEKLYESYKDKGLVIVGFPANNFNGQEPGSNEEIKTFCTSKYNVSFPMMSKISVKGEDQHPLYKMLTDAKGPVTWNFDKFLIGKDGKIVEHFPAKVKPDNEKLTGAIDEALKQ
jgi:glutathione peroxidase